MIRKGVHRGGGGLRNAGNVYAIRSKQSSAASEGKAQGVPGRGGRGASKGQGGRGKPRSASGGGRDWSGCLAAGRDGFCMEETGIRAGIRPGAARKWAAPDFKRKYSALKFFRTAVRLETTPAHSPGGQRRRC